jgi:hypothetical protein
MFYYRSIVSFTAFTITLLIVTFPSTVVGADESSLEYYRQTFPTSLHGTRFGKLTLYSERHGGLETLTNIPIEQLGGGMCLKCYGETLCPLDAGRPSFWGSRRAFIYSHEPLEA